MDPSLVSNLSDFGKVLFTDENELSRVRAFGQQARLELLTRRLRSPQRRSLLLVGPSGVGKTALIHELARQAQSWPEPIVVLETTTSLLLAGTRYLGELETRVKRLIDLARPPNRVLLYFTDIAFLPTAGTTVQSKDSIGSFLAPLMERGDLVLCGECTSEQYRLTLENNPTFNKLFETLRLEEVDLPTTRQIVTEVAADYERRALEEQALLLSIPERTRQAVVELSLDYFPGRVYPGKALHLLEHVVEGELTRWLEGGCAAETLTVGPEAAIAALEQITGIPGQLLDDTQPLDLHDVGKFFEARVIGQREATDAMVDLITLVKAGLTDPYKPMGVFLFVGPTGVGKTELARAVAEFIFGHPDRLIRYDMSEYKDYASFEKLIGNPQAQDQSPMRRGSLVSRVQQQPFSVILFDEIEKAHPNIFDLFLQLFDAGRLADAVGQVTSFKKTIVIMTSNVGSDLARPASFGFRAESEPLDMNEQIGEALRRQFRPEFLNRIDRIVAFAPLEREQMRIIAQRELGRVLLRSGIARRDLVVDVDPGVIEVLLKHGFNREYGARPLKRAVERLALLPIARQMVKISAGNAPAVLRLQPVGDVIQVRLIDEPQRRQSVAVKVDVANPFRNRKLKLTREQLEERVAALETRVDMLESGVQTAGLTRRKADLLERTIAVDFWDKPVEAKEVLSEVHRLEQTLTAVQRVRKRVADLRNLFSATTRRASNQLSAAADRLLEIERDLDLVEYMAVCRSPVERADAVVSITMVEPVPAEDDLVGLLADMYLNWAHHKGLSTAVVHEALFDGGSTRELVALIGGVSAYGVLCGEDGIHEFNYGKTSKQPKVGRYVRVRVLPIIDTPGVDLGPQHVESRRAIAKGAGKHVARYKSRVTLTHRPSLVSVQAANGLAPEKSAELCRDWLQAELARRKMNASANGATPGTETVVRKYMLRPTSSACDERTGVSISALRELWNGALDVFLHAHLAEHAQATPAPVNGQPAGPA